MEHKEISRCRAETSLNRMQSIVQKALCISLCEQTPPFSMNSNHENGVVTLFPIAHAAGLLTDLVEDLEVTFLGTETNPSARTTNAALLVRLFI